ncbi:MBL fold metallo-hydrolase [Roseococcus sp. YIM B11640]|uniref:MBL fold metallo-hydrolase n=1 Tax=Roseococcus sp. YIM B11640 TaxID=3133973 RepID=UPI003C7CBCD5
MRLPPSQRDAKGRYRNPDGGVAGQSLRNVWRMMRERGGTPWPASLTDPPQPPPPDEVPHGHAAFTFVGHSTFLIRLDDGTTILTDPIFSERCSPVTWAGPKRVRPPALALDALPRIDAVLVSHGHYDHLDIPSLRALHARFRPAIFTGLGHAALMARHGIPGATELDWGGEALLPGGHRATYLPMRHFSARGIHDRSKALWGGFAVEPATGGRLAFLGDTAAGGHLDVIGRAFGGFGAALIPIGAYEPVWFMQAVHMTPEQALEAQLQLRARTAIAMHFGTFKLTQEAIDEPVRRLEAGRNGQDFRVPLFGGTQVVPLRAGP